ncbi:hypothetical protein GWO43_10310 [candidate division KSB1 bacterium]|nr:hypothetical protein [candidate division KSB1 bacterium]NIR69689.1 hypothetical protein [candidate division KSB1 bacterium]NIS24339.1 hypothetical protein [candidate division KSB1 bacterium]NIT71267.1 hypothetical protein [candidate division KSB1 bacterium]NIU24973.1 hypothetical protein [candidate division KSB1 bacterium]
MRVVALMIFLNLIVFSCSEKEKSVALEPGTSGYELAKALSKKLEYLNPDENNVLITTNHFDIRTGEVIRTLQDNFGTRVNQLGMLDVEQLESTIENNARQLAEKKLLLQKAEEAAMKIDETEVDSVLSMEYTRAGGEEKYMEILERNGLTLEHVKNVIRNSLMIKHFLDKELAAETDVSDEEIQEAYEVDKTATVRHILLSTQGKSDSAKMAIREKMEEILARAKAGEDFAKLAQKYSEDPGSAEKGGLYESFGRGRMVPPFEEAAFNVPVGEISDVVETRFGYHIIKVIERERETRSLEEIRPQIEAQLEKKKYQEALQSYLTKIREEANYKVVEPSLGA